MLNRDIDRFILSRERWVKEKLAESNGKKALRKDFSLNYGDYLMYRGKQYPITIKQGDRVGFDDEGFYIPPDLTPEQIKHACIQIYRVLAKRDLTKIALALSGKMSVTPTAIRINSAKSRWGSCSVRESVNFSWKLIMADDDIIEYVVVHELAHITELNHSKRFWALVKSVLPDYTERKVRLKELQDKLAGEDWE